MAQHALVTGRNEKKCGCERRCGSPDCPADTVARALRDEALRIIFVSDLLSDQTDGENPDDAEFLSSVRAERRVCAALARAVSLSAAVPPRRQLSQGLASYNIQLHTYFIPRPGVAAPVAAREALRKLTAEVHGARAPLVSMHARALALT